MINEVALAFARCRGKPSFLPILEQLGSFNAELVPEVEPEPEMSTETIITTSTTPPPPTTTTISPVKQVPLVVFQKPVAPQVVRRITPIADR